MRLSLFLVALLTMSGLPRAAFADVTACELLSKADVERITGLKVADPEVRRLNVCGGLCESLDGWRCMYRSVKDGASRRVWLDLYIPPFDSKDVLATDETISQSDHLARTTRLAVGGFSAFWYFRSDQAHSFLHIDAGREAHFLIGQDGVTRYGSALDQATAISELVLRRYQDMTRFEAKTPEK